MPVNSQAKLRLFSKKNNDSRSFSQIFGNMYYRTTNYRRHTHKLSRKMGKKPIRKQQDLICCKFIIGLIYREVTKVYINMRDDIVYAGAVSSCLCQIPNKKYCYLLCVLVLCTSQVKMMLLLWLHIHNSRLKNMPDHGRPIEPTDQGSPDLLRDWLQRHQSLLLNM